MDFWIAAWRRMRPGISAIALCAMMMNGYYLAGDREAEAILRGPWARVWSEFPRSRCSGFSIGAFAAPRLGERPAKSRVRTRTRRSAPIWTSGDAFGVHAARASYRW
nr:hypothetical protein GCM10025732_55580 [Glycomyces mayteni]